jgi:hypothetical protein
MQGSVVMARSDRFLLIALAGASLLTACDRSDKTANLAALDAQLTNNAVDPALKGALSAQIVVDPNLTSQSNRNAIRPTDTPANGALPVLTGDAKKAASEAQRLAGGKLLSTPAPVTGKPIDRTTLGALAREQGFRTNVDCKAKLAYGAQWATRMPEPFGIYPGAQLMEAAGAEANGCTLRAASFVTSVPKQGVLDYYYTQARRAGYDGEHQLLEGDHVLGGTRANDKAAYLVIVRDAPGGKTSVDILADGGR